MFVPNQYGEKNDDTRITRDELRKIEKAMVKPEFQELLGDYMKEISDPKNKEEYDQYLRQLENDKELPKGMQLIKPEAQMCLKTTIWQKQNKKHEQKLFVNICSTSVIDKPQAEEIIKDGQKGQMWKLPFSIGKIRYDQDKKGAVCNTVDVAFHPITIGYTNKFPGFLNLVCQTALDAVQKQLGERKEDISKDYKVLKRIKCKGGEPSLLPIRTDKKQSQIEQRQGGMNNMQTKLQKDIMEQQKDYQQKKNQEQEKQKGINEQQLEDDDDIEIKESEEIDSKSVSQPKYKFVHSYPVEYSDFLDQRQQFVKKRPNVLGLNITLIKIKSVKEVSLDLSENTLILDVPEKYYLNITLPYPIVSSEGNAKFDSKTKILKIRAPINPQYLKQKAQEDVELAQKQLPQPPVQSQDQNKNQDDQTDRDQNEMHFLPEQQINESQESQLEKQHTLIQEIDNQQKNEINHVRRENQIQQISEQQIEKENIYNKLSFMKRFDQNSLFLIMKLKQYNSEKLQSIIWNNQLIIYYLEENELYFHHYFIHLQFQDINNKESHIQLVQDFIIAKICKDSEWEKDVEILDHDYTEKPFQDFLNNFDIIKSAKQEYLKNEEIQILEKKQTEELDQDRKNNENNDSQQNFNIEIDKNQSIEQQSIEEIKQEKEKITIQFIDFRNFASLAYDID